MSKSSIGCVNMYGITRQIPNVCCHPDHCNHFASFLLTMLYISYHPTPTFTVLLACLVGITNSSQQTLTQRLAPPPKAPVQSAQCLTQSEFNITFYNHFIQGCI